MDETFWNNRFSEKLNDFYYNGFIKEVKIIFDYLKSGEILELGCGDGRNLFNLGENKNYNILGVDFSGVAISKVLKFSEKKNKNINGKKANVLIYDYENKLWDLILITFLLHIFHKKEAIYIIGNMQNHTKIGGFNFILAFIDSKNNKDFWKSTFSINELRDNHYKDWKIIEYKIIKYKLKDGDIKEAAFLFAQKIK